MSNEIDKECIKICDAINLYNPDIETIESCCGHEKSEFLVFFRVYDLEVLPEILYFFDPCHNGFYRENIKDLPYGAHAWRVTVKTDCIMQYPTFCLSGPVGQEAYEQADEIAEMITKCFNQDTLGDKLSI